MANISVRTASIGRNRSGSNLLSVSYGFPGTGSLSGNWTAVQLDGAGAVKEYSADFGPDGVAGDTYAFWNGASFTSNQQSQITLDTLGVSDSMVGLVVRASGSNNCYFFRVGRIAGLAKRDLFAIVSGVVTSLYSDAVAGSPGDVYVLNAIGTTITLKCNGSTVFTTTDSSLSSGSPGIVTWCAAAETSARAHYWIGGKPGTYRLDGFTGSGTLSSNWTMAQDSSVAINQFAGSFGPSASGSGDAWAVRNDAVFSNDQFSQMTLVTTGTNGAAGVTVRADAAGGLTHSYFARAGFGYITGGVPIRTLYSVVSGVYTLLWSDAVAGVPGDVYKLSAVGTTITFTCNGSILFTGTNTAIATGSPGIIVSANVNDARGGSWIGGDV